MSAAPSPLSCGRLGPEGVLREIQTNLLECKVCFEKFSGQQRERRPRNLPCGHVLCLECLTSLSHPLLRKLECPFCRQLCSLSDTSDCLPLSDLSELLLCGSPRPAIPRRVSGGASWVGGLDSGALHLHSAFGGWGSLINPTGVTVFGSSGAVAVVHDGDKRVVVFSPQGRWLHEFGRRGHAAADICHSLDVAVAPSGHIVVTDTGDSAVKVFTSRGRSVVTVRDSFELPWGVDIDSRGHILVTDAQAGTLSEVVVDFVRGLTVLNRVAYAGLQCPRSVACCRVTGNIAVVEHLGGLADRETGCGSTQLKIFNSELTLLSQIDSFGLRLVSPVRLCISAVAFDRGGDVIVADVGLGMIWSLGNPRNLPILTPLVSHGLVRPMGLIATAQNILIVLDSGDHVIKVYAASSDSTITQ
ncbi:E3 ubiquitin-protein ligase NHLRC1-like [Megalops cyprinoides]|uniref:E3 ubiquitin-protein ligase NHLRC1-like n=1 Tax=Megalops cyprinoides TaxID=118141 RepID=UPI0018641C93|nr:E3 ubiquitin-protein ligase NHLRC1-like [Megalops cyprinoides]